MKSGTRQYTGISTAAPGWFAVYHDGDGPDLWEPVCAWVLVTEDGDSYVDGVDPTGEGWDGSACSEMSSFLRFEFDPSRGSGRKGVEKAGDRGLVCAAPVKGGAVVE